VGKCVLCSVADLDPACELGACACAVVVSSTKAMSEIATWHLCDRPRYAYHDQRQNFQNCLCATYGCNTAIPYLHAPGRRFRPAGACWVMGPFLHRISRQGIRPRCADGTGTSTARCILPGKLNPTQRLCLVCLPEPFTKQMGLNMAVEVGFSAQLCHAYSTNGLAPTLSPPG